MGRPGLDPLMMRGSSAEGHKGHEGTGAHEVWREEAGVGCAQPGEQSWDKQQLISALTALEIQK